MLNAHVQPYLFFDGRCEVAVNYYQKVLGAQVDLMMRFKESPQPFPPGVIPPDYGDKIMHCTFRVGQTTLMASDEPQKGVTFGGFSLSFVVPTIAEADQVFAALADGGKVCMPMSKTFWSPWFGMLSDRFGLRWMVSVAS